MKTTFYFFLLIPFFAFSQLTKIDGIVYDDNGDPLPGATVQVKGVEEVGAITNFDGEFSINLESGDDSIIVSYVGFISKTIRLSGETNIVISLDQDVSELEEVVVIGYGTVLKKDLTGSVASVKVDDEISRQSSTVDQLLQGRAAGIQVTQNAANPNSGISVRIRGTNSLRGNNEPLYVVDGVIVSSAGEDVASAGGFGTGQERQSGLNGINPRDIERIEVLKDASATAIYGSRGANGVVLITTKKGESGNNKMNAFFTRSYRSVSKRLDVLDPLEYVEYSNMANSLNNAGPHWAVVDDVIYGIQDQNSDNPIVLSTPAVLYNWHDEIYRTGESSNFGVSFSGGGDSGSYYVSAGFQDQRGLVDNSSFKSGDFRINLNQKINDRTSIEGRLSSFFSESDFSEGGDLIGNYQSFVRNVLMFRPVFKQGYDNLADPLSIYSDESIDEERDTSSNPFAWIDDFHDESVENRFFASLSFKHKLNVKGLSYELRFGGNIRSKERRRFYGPTTYQGRLNGGFLQISGLNSTAYQVNNFLRYNRNFNRTHRVNATLGITYDVRDVSNNIYAVSQFDTFELTTQQAFLGQNIVTPFADISNDQKMFSFLGRLNYTLLNKYIFTASFRRDGVSKFAEDNRYGFFPSFAFAYRDNFNNSSNYKLRLGWGQIGNHGIGPYGTLSNFGSDPDAIYGTPNNGSTIPLLLNNLANPELTWETTEQTNVGVDLELFDGKLNATIDVYEKLTKDLLQDAPIPTSSGFSSILINRGELENKGYEVGLDATLIDNKDFKLSFGANLSQNKTKIKNLGLPPADLIMPSSDAYNVEQRPFYLGRNVSRGSIFQHPANIFIEGEESALFYGWKTDGIIQEDDLANYPQTVEGTAQAGDIKILDLNNDGMIDEHDRTVIGNPNPDFVYGFNVNVNYKNFSLSMLFNGVEGNDIANGWKYQLGMAEGANGQGGSSYTRNVLSPAYHNAWSPDNTDTTYPRIGYTTNGNKAMMDYIIEDGSYLRLNNITLNYNIPIKKIEQKVLSEDDIHFGEFTYAGFSKLIKPTSMNIYLTAQNLFTWTNYSGYDPEVTSFMWTGLIQGVDWNGPPNAKNILLGVNMTF